VGLKYQGGNLTCDEVVYGDDDDDKNGQDRKGQKIVELRCTIDKSEGRVKPKTFITWVPSDGIPCEVRVYGHLFTAPEPTDRWEEELNSTSEIIHPNAIVDPSVRDYVSDDDDDGAATDVDPAGGFEGVEWELNRLMARSGLPPAVPGSDGPSVNCADLTMGRHSFFLSLSFPDVDDTAPYVEAMCADVDAMEYRADLIAKRDDRFELSYQLQRVRRMCRPHASRAPRLPLSGSSEVIEDSIPIVYTVRTAHQA